MQRSRVGIGFDGEPARVGTAVACLGLLAVATAACEQRPERTPTQTFPVVEAAVPDTDLSGRVTTVLSLGVIEGNVNQEFGFVRGVVRSENGSLYVLDVMAKEVRVFGPDGVFSRKMGRKGGGPGELESPVQLGVTGDTVSVWDLGLWRVTAYDTLGHFLATSAVEPARQFGWPGEWEYRRLASGRWLHLEQNVLPGAVAAGGAKFYRVIRATAVFRAWDSAAHEWGEVVSVPGGEAAITPGPQGAPSLSNAPFPAVPLWHVTPLEGFWYADSKSYRLVHYREDGTIVLEIQVARLGARVTRADRRRFLAPPNLPPEMLKRVEAERRRMAMPDRKPVLRALRVSDEGDVWVLVRAEDAAADEWHVFTDDGRPRFRVTLPASFRPYQIIDRMLVGVEKDEVGVSRVVIKVLGNPVRGSDG